MTGVAQRAAEVLEEKRKVERERRNAAAQREAIQRAARIERDSAPFIPILQNGEFADPEWVVEDVVYTNGDLTAPVRGVIFTHPTFHVPDIFVSPSGTVHEAAKSSTGYRYDRSQWSWAQPLTLEYLGAIIERKRQEYDEMMSRD